MLWLTRHITGKDPAPARLLTWFPRGAIGAGLFELSAADGRHLDPRVLAIARIVASAVAGCPFCLDMNAAAWARAGLTREELATLVEARPPPSLSAREHIALRYAEALSRTPVSLGTELEQALRAHYSARELVVLATTVAQVNFWSRFNQGLGVPAAGFLAEDVCRLPTPAPR
jgi:AhpD family alkylhydroperoxidase